jgi:hypothetical protein
MPSFRFMGLTGHDRQASSQGIAYAAPAMMALSNLLSHPTITDVRIESGELEGMRRCSKDLGRVLALAYLAGREVTEGWPASWREGLVKAFPRTWREHASRAGAGIRALMDDTDAMNEAAKFNEISLLNGLGVDARAMRGTAERLLVDAVEPLEEMGRGA